MTKEERYQASAEELLRLVGGKDLRRGGTRHI